MLVQQETRHFFTVQRHISIEHIGDLLQKKFCFTNFTGPKGNRVLTLLQIKSPISGPQRIVQSGGLSSLSLNVSMRAPLKEVVLEAFLESLGVLLWTTLPYKRGTQSCKRKTEACKGKVLGYSGAYKDTLPCSC